MSSHALSVINCIYCNGYKQWVHQKCSNQILIIGMNCSAAHPIDGRPQSEVQGGPDRLKVVASFCYLGDMLFAGRG